MPQPVTPAVARADSDRWLPDRGVLLHVGPPKTGTTALQSALAVRRAELAELGVLYPGRGRSTQHGKAAGALLGRRMAGSTEVEPEATWRKLTRAVARRTDRAVVSSELFADVTGDRIGRAVAGLGGDDVRVLITLRPLDAVLGSVWQQDLKGGRISALDDWLTARLRGPADTPDVRAFWLRQRHDELVTRWADALGPDRVSVVIVDSREPQALLRAAEELVGLPTGLLTAPLTNRSLSREEAGLLAEFHERLGPLDAARYQRWVRLGAFRGLVENRRPGDGETRITLPAWARREARDLGRRMTEAILASGVRVVGDPQVLLPQDDILEVTDAPATDWIPVDAAVEFALGLLRAAEADADRTVVLPAPPSAPEPAGRIGDEPTHRRWRRRRS